MPRHDHRHQSRTRIEGAAPPLRGYSMEKQAELTALSPESLSNLERGINQPGLVTIDAPRTALGVLV